MTANPRWPEIVEALLPGQKAEDRPDIVARMFNMKKKALLKDIYENGIFGRAAAYIYTIEFQKRGLPHMHLLIFLAQPYKIMSPEEVDLVVSAVWPDPVTQPLLFETVQSNMIHGPCGTTDMRAPCMEDGKCTKRYPKDYRETTVLEEQGYPKYRRPDDGRRFVVKGFELDNRWVVPHNPYLTAKYNCHINVEVAASFATLKYIAKYIHKGHDQATVELYKRDEIMRYKVCRFIAASESCWQTFHFDMHHIVPNVVRLQIHLPGQHQVLFDPNEDPTALLERARSEQTLLTAFFDANSDLGALGELARQYTYQEFPQHFVLKKAAGNVEWSVRKRGFALGRMFFVSPNSGERFYLRTLLTAVKGPKSFEDLRSFNGEVLPTFCHACIARGLLEDDGEWRQCLVEAVLMQTGSRLHSLFATILVFCNPTYPERLWMEFREGICDDLARRLPALGFPVPTPEIVYDYGLFLLDGLLWDCGRSLADSSPMSLPLRNWTAREDNTLIADQLSYDVEHEKERLDVCLPMLNEKQRLAYDQVIDSVENRSGKLFFLNGPAGTGKTFLYNTICHKVQSCSGIVLCVASSGIASLLLKGGRTSHSMFKIPVEDLTDKSFCKISKQGDLAGLMRNVQLIIWDEIPMQHRFGPEAVSRTLQDLWNDDRSLEVQPHWLAGIINRPSRSF